MKTGQQGLYCIMRGGYMGQPILPTEVKGRIFELDGCKFLVVKHDTCAYQLWHTYDYRSGLSVAYGPTMKDAITATERKLEEYMAKRNKTTIRDLVEDCTREAEALNN